MKASLGVLASGRGSNFEAIARACREGRVSGRVEVVITNRADAPVREKARELQIPDRYVPHRENHRKEFERKAAEILNSRGCDLILLAGFMRILSPWILGRFPGRILNIHPSLLPAFRGLDAQKQALEHGVKVTGCTVHVVTESLDDGPIVDQAAVRVRENDTEQSLSRRILEREHELYPRAVETYIQHHLWLTSERNTKNTPQKRANPAPQTEGRHLYP